MPETTIPAGAIEALWSDPDLAGRRAAILKALGNPARLRVVAYLCAEGERSVGEICVALDLPQSSASRQLAWLRLHGLVRAEARDGHRYYSLALPQLATLMACLSGCRPVRSREGG